MDERDGRAPLVPLAPWLAEVVRTLPGLLRSYVPGGPVPPRTRERVILAVTEVNGARWSAWVHGAWQDFLGDADPDEAEAELLAYARACADAGVPLPAHGLLTTLPPAAVDAVRATVAQTEVANLVGSAADRVAGRLLGRRPLAPLALAREVTTVAVALPFAMSRLAVAAAMRAVEQAAPPLPAVEAPEGDEANLLAHLLAAAVPTYLANALVRTVTVGSPVPLVVGIRAGRTAATIRVGRGRVAVENGIASDALVVVEGEVEPLVRHATGSLLTELGALRLRGS